MVDEKQGLIGTYWRGVFFVLSIAIFKYMEKSATCVAWIGKEGTLVYLKVDLTLSDFIQSWFICSSE